MPTRPKSHHPVFYKADKQRKAEHEKTRLSSSQRGYGYKWQQVRLAYINAHPLCATCGQEATVVDHIKPHKGDMTAFWDSSNWQALCKRCHDSKTAREDGRWM